MEYKKRTVDFEDARGTIMDILTHTPLEHVTIIASKKGSVRGNHYHKHTTQWDFVIQGRMHVRNQRVGESSVTEIVAETNTLIKHEPMEAHAFLVEEDTVFLSLTQGPRGGADYETDTIRLETPLFATTS